jgi:hypothetical protein
MQPVKQFSFYACDSLLFLECSVTLNHHLSTGKYFL